MTPLVLPIVLIDGTALAYTEHHGMARSPIVNSGSYMAECHVFSQELLFVLWWCRQDGFRQFFIIGSLFSRKDCNYFK